nr:ethylene-responsive transcription factor 9 [Tanacetum cinerariifolium]
MPRRSTIEAIHLLISLMEKYKERQKDLHMAFLDLEKAYDSVPRELVWKSLLDKGTPRRYLRVIKDMYEEAKTRVRTTVGNIVFPESTERLNNRLESWRKTLKDSGLRRRPQSALVRRVEAMVVKGSRRMGRPKLRWEDRLKIDMKELRFSEDITSDRNAWRNRIRISRKLRWRPKVANKTGKDGKSNDVINDNENFLEKVAVVANEVGYKFDIKNRVSPALNIHMAHFPFRVPDGHTQYLAVPR